MNAAARRRLLLAVLFLGWAHGASAQTADDIVEKNLTAIGGRAALAKLKSRTTTGTVTISTPGGDIAGPIEIMNAQPNKSRTLIKVDLSQFGAGQMTVDQRFDGTTGYILDNMQGNRDITGNQLDNMRNGAFPSPFLNYKAMGVGLTLAGKEKVGDRDVYVLVLEPPAGSTARVSIDAESYLMLKMVMKVSAPQVGEFEQTSEFRDYREVDGVKVPFQVTATSSVQTISIAVAKVEHNGTIDQSLFSKPKQN
jgi:hypothetical protein